MIPYLKTDCRAKRKFRETFKNKTNDTYNLELMPAIFFEHPSIGSFTDYLCEEHKDRLAVYYRDKLKKDATGRNDILESTVERPAIRSRFMAQTSSPPLLHSADKPKKSTRDMAIIGLSGKFPMAEDMGAFWENLKSGRDCITEIPKERWDYQQYPGMYCKWGGFLEDFDKFDAQFFNISPNTARSLDPQARLFLQTVWSCIEDAGCTRKRMADPGAGNKRANIGVFAGVTFDDYQLHASAQGTFGSQMFSVANRVSYFFNFRGPSLTVDAACSSSLYAVHLACESIINGECEMAVAGGVNLSLHPAKYMNLCRLGLASSNGRCRSFAKGGDGYVPGEGVAAVLLKPLEKAIRDQDHIRAVIKGIAVNHDGKTYGYTVPNPVAQSEVIKAAIARADIAPRTISYVEAQATGTALGDTIEMAGITEAYKDNTDEKQYCAIGSVKANIGHSEAAAGMAQLAKVVLQMEHRTLAPLLLHAERNPDIDFEKSPFFVQQKMEKWTRPVVRGKSYPRRAGVSSFGAGGVNVHVIVEEYEGKEALLPDKAADGFSLIPLSANTEESLEEYVRRFEKFLRNKAGDKKTPALRDIAYTLQTGREPMRFRAAFVVKTTGELVEKLGGFSPGSVNEPGEGIFYGQKQAFNTAKGMNDLGDNLAERNMKELAELWVSDADFDWDALYPEDKPRRISLPTYPFLKQRYWIAESPGLPDLSPAPSEISVDPKDDPGYDKNDLSKISPFLLELAEAPEKEQREMISSFLQKKVGALLGFAPDEPPAPDQGFFAMGMESMQAIALQADIEDTFRVKISDTAAFDYPDIKMFSGYLLSLIPFDDLPLDEEPIAEYMADEESEPLFEISDNDLLYLNPGPLSDETMNMDIEEVEKNLKTEIEYFSKKMQRAECEIQ